MKTLVLVFHPHLEKSQVNRKLMDAANETGDVTVVDEYAAYPDFKINVEHEQELIETHDRIVLQFPFYWYSSPALLKQWEDDVIKAGWAYGGGRASKARSSCWPCPPALRRTPTRVKAAMWRTMEELLSPFETTFRHTHATYLKPFLIQGVATSTDEQIDAAVAKYPAALIG